MSDWEGPRLVARSFEPEQFKGATYLWKPYIPSPGLTLLAGEEGIGKTMLTAHLAAQVSRGSLGGDVDRRGVLMAFTEDTANEVIGPRLQAAGADFKRVQQIVLEHDDGFNARAMAIQDHLDDLLRLLLDTRPALVIFDPLVAFLSSRSDAHNYKSMMQQLELVARLCEHANCAALGLMHFNKAQTGNALNKLNGSKAFTASARSVLLLGKDRDHGDMVHLVHAKLNVGPPGDALLGRIQSREVEGADGQPIETAIYEAAGASDWTAADVLGSADGTTTGGGERFSKAREFLLMQLMKGPKEAKALTEAAKKEGIAERTLKRAKKDLGVVTKARRSKGGKIAQHQWALPDEGDDA